MIRRPGAQRIGPPYTSISTPAPPLLRSPSARGPANPRHPIAGASSRLPNARHGARARTGSSTSPIPNVRRHRSRNRPVTWMSLKAEPTTMAPSRTAMHDNSIVSANVRNPAKLLPLSERSNRRGGAAYITLHRAAPNASARPVRGRMPAPDRVERPLPPSRGTWEGNLTVSANIMRDGRCPCTTLWRKPAVATQKAARFPVRLRACPGTGRSYLILPSL